MIKGNRLRPASYAIGDCMSRRTLVPAATQHELSGAPLKFFGPEHVSVVQICSSVNDSAKSALYLTPSAWLGDHQTLRSEHPGRSTKTSQSDELSNRACAALAVQRHWDAKVSIRSNNHQTAYEALSSSELATMRKDRRLLLHEQSSAPNQRIDLHHRVPNHKRPRYVGGG